MHFENAAKAGVRYSVFANYVGCFNLYIDFFFCQETFVIFQACLTFSRRKHSWNLFIFEITDENRVSGFWYDFNVTRKIAERKRWHWLLITVPLDWILLESNKEIRTLQTIRHTVHIVLKWSAQKNHLRLLRSEALPLINVIDKRLWEKVANLWVVWHRLSRKSVKFPQNKKSTFHTDFFIFL